jgi:hypothetical protein
MCEEMFTHTIKSLWQDMPGGGDWHFVWATAEEQTKKRMRQVLSVLRS